MIKFAIFWYVSVSIFFNLCEFFSGSEVGWGEVIVASVCSALVIDEMLTNKKESL